MSHSINLDTLHRHLHLYQPDQNQPVEVCLYVTTKAFRLKVVNLDELRAGKYTHKVSKWKDADRFVVVMKHIDGSLFAYAQAKIAEQMQKNKDLTIEGKSVVVKSLSDDEYQQLLSISEILQGIDAEKTNETGVIKPQKVTSPREIYAPKTHASADSMVHLSTEMTLGQIQNRPAEIIRAFLDSVMQERRVEQARAEEDRKRQSIREQELAKEILKKEVTQDEVTAQIDKGEVI